MTSPQSEPTGNAAARDAAGARPAAVHSCHPGDVLHAGVPRRCCCSKRASPPASASPIEFLMLASAASVVAGLIIATQSSGASADASSKVATWSGALVLELLGVVSMLNAMPPLFHQLAHSTLLKALAPGATRCIAGPHRVHPRGRHHPVHGVSAGWLRHAELRGAQGA